LRCRAILFAVIDNLFENHVEASGTNSPLDLGRSCEAASGLALAAPDRVQKTPLLTWKPRKEDRCHGSRLFDVVEELEDEIERRAILGDVATADDAHREYCGETRG